MTRGLQTLALVAALLTGCRDTTSPESVAGTYELDSVGSQALPVVLHSEPNYSFEIAASTVTLDPNGTFGETFVYNVNDAGAMFTQANVCTGSWAKSGNALTLQEAAPGACGALNTATWDGRDVLTITSPRFASPAVYKR